MQVKTCHAESKKDNMSENQIGTRASGPQDLDFQYYSQDITIVPQGKINTFNEDQIG